MTYRVGDTVRHKDSSRLYKITYIEEVRGVKWIHLEGDGFYWVFREAEFLTSYEVVEDEGA